MPTLCRVWMLASCIAFVTAACSDSGRAEQQPTQTGVVPHSVYLKPAIDLTTPDRAVKSYWAVRDYADLNDYEIAKIINTPEFKEKRAMITAVLAGAAREETDETFQRANARESFRREIVTVKQETDTRAVVETRIFNTTPIPEDAELDDDDKKRRRDGVPIRYILEKDSVWLEGGSGEDGTLASLETEWQDWFRPGRKFVPTHAYP